ncbi:MULTISPECIES: ArsR/SmtB family transcription factor [Clostridium]|uniref:ArsR/SmtB family transcription factor n=1 Tax=Clostridium TaxID=1485 RepID=UPI00069F6BA2|nr:MULTISPECIES: winged helix-turn-helix domain-containing protein [Clostridium]MCD2345499.1 winged helix-turn-helix domain-containing protein [Clostridium guangxiense]
MNNFEEKAPKVYLKKSMVIELISITLSIFNKDEECKGLVQKVYGKTFVDEVTSKYKNLEVLIKSLKDGGYGIFEFLYLNREFDDVEKYIESVKNTTKESFFYNFWGLEINEEKIKKVLKNDRNLEEFFYGYKYLCDDLDCFKFIVNNRQEFLDMILKCTLEFYTDEFNKLMDNLYDSYKNEFIKLENELKSNEPIEISQNIMGRNFRRKDPYEEYIFIPSYFLIGRYVRYMSDIQVLAYKMIESAEVKVDKMFQVLKVISDSTRFEILKLLMKEPMYGKQISEIVNLTTPTISHHLELLRSVGIISEERIKNIKYFSANGNEIKKFLSWIGENLDISQLPHAENK